MSVAGGCGPKMHAGFSNNFSIISLHCLSKYFIAVVPWQLLEKSLMPRAIAVGPSNSRLELGRSFEYDDEAQVYPW